MQFRSILLALFFLTDSALGFAMWTDTCCTRTTGGVSYWDVKVHYSNSGGSITSASAAALVTAWTADVTWDQSTEPCDEDNLNGVEIDTAGDSADLLSRSISITASNGDDHNWDAMGYAQVGAGARSGDIESSHVTGTGGRDYLWTGDCRSGGSKTLFGFGNGIAAMSGNWTFSGLWSWTTSVTLTGSFTAIDTDGCPGYCRPAPPPVCSVLHDHNHVAFVSVHETRGAASVYKQGVYATQEDGTITRLGVFTDSAFNPSYNGSDFTVSSGSVNLPSIGGSGSARSIEATCDGFGKFDGDIDADTSVCWADRDDFMPRLGSSINSANYTARADFDLDGDIDNSDLALFNAIGCTADVDCSGSLDLFDYTGFQNKYNAHDPSADMNHDASWDTFDYLQFQNTYNAGCP